MDVRSRNYQNFSKVTKFSYPWRFAIKIYIDSCQNRATTDKYHITISKARVVVPKSYRVSDSGRLRKFSRLRAASFFA